MSQEYTPGRINIGEDEIRHRRLTYGWGGLVLTFAIFVILKFFDVSFIVFLLLSIPIYISFIGFYQAKNKFCISYGKSGVCNIAGQTGETRDVIGKLNRNKDSQKSNKMLLVSLAASTVITLAIAFIST